MKNLGYSQNFLVNKKLVERLISKSNIDVTDYVIEIGPGKGIITDVLSQHAGEVVAVEYDQELYKELLGQGFTWLDTGTHESLVDATNFVKTVETHQNRKIACLEEIAYNNGWISKDELNTAYELYKKNQYGKYLKDVMDGKFIDQ